MTNEEITTMQVAIKALMKASHNIVDSVSAFTSTKKGASKAVNELMLASRKLEAVMRTVEEKVKF